MLSKNIRKIADKVYEQQRKDLEQNPEREFDAMEDQVVIEHFEYRDIINDCAQKAFEKILEDFSDTDWYYEGLNKYAKANPDKVLKMIGTIMLNILR